MKGEKFPNDALVKEKRKRKQNEEYIDNWNFSQL